MLSQGQHSCCFFFMLRKGKLLLLLIFVLSEGGGKAWVCMNETEAPPLSLDPEGAFDQMQALG